MHFSWEKKAMPSRENLPARVANKRFVGEFDINYLVEHPQNPNVGAVDVISKSLAAHGFVGVVIAQESVHVCDDNIARHHILAGNHRYRALRETGAATVPVIFVDFDDTQALQFLLVDNKAAEEGHRDEGQLLDVLRWLDENDALDGSGYLHEELDDLTDRLGQGDTFEDLDPASDDTLAFTQIELTIRLPRERMAPELEAAVKELALTCGGRYIVKGARESSDAVSSTT
jgi:ParB-like chromosome segregation protein Spo0J